MKESRPVVFSPEGNRFPGVVQVRAMGNGLEAQQAAVRGYLSASAPIAEFTEIESGRRNDRPQLEQALALQAQGRRGEWQPN
jgi:hypothetical protein